MVDTRKVVWLCLACSVGGFALAKQDTWESLLICVGCGAASGALVLLVMWLAKDLIVEVKAAGKAEQSQRRIRP